MVVPVVPPEFAVIVLVPAAMQFAKPATLGAFAMVATLEDEELQCAFSVTSCELPSLNVPVATNCCVLPAEAVGAAGVTAMDVNVPVPIVKVVLPLIPEELAEMVTVPFFFPCAMPDERMDATLGLEDFQDTPLKLLATLPSLNVPVAVNLIDVPVLMRGVAGVTLIDTR